MNKTDFINMVNGEESLEHKCEAAEKVYKDFIKIIIFIKVKLWINFM